MCQMSNKNIENYGIGALYIWNIHLLTQKSDIASTVFKNYEFLA